MSLDNIIKWIRPSVDAPPAYIFCTRFALLMLFDILTTICAVRLVLSFNDVMTSHQRSGFCIRWLKLEKLGKSHFWLCDLDLWPMTLTIILGLDFVKVNACNFHAHPSNSLALRALTNWQTDGKTVRRKDRNTGPILLPRPLTREVKSMYLPGNL